MHAPRRTRPLPTIQRELTVQASANLMRHERHDLVRDEDKTDAAYADRSALFGALLDHARHG